MITAVVRLPDKEPYLLVTWDETTTSLAQVEAWLNGAPTITIVQAPPAFTLGE